MVGPHPEVLHHLRGVIREVIKAVAEVFAQSCRSLLRGIDGKTDGMRTGRSVFAYSVPGYGDLVDRTLEDLREHRVVARLWDHDHTLWKDSPTEITDRLGWLSSPADMKAVSGRIRSAVDHLRLEGYTDALLLGMGGSSLAPDLFGRTFSPKEGYLRLSVLDTTDPGAILHQAESLDLEKTLFVVSTKSGTTAETHSLFKFFFNRVMPVSGPGGAGRHFLAITDPGSALQTLARDLGFREIFLNDPEIGGRYSALSFFGLVPAALMGLDLDLLLERAAETAVRCTVERDGTAAVLGAIMGGLHNRGVDKLTFITSPPIASLGAWIEQLIAESTGKEGKGIVPVDGELPALGDVYGRDRLFVYLKLCGDTTWDSAAAHLEKAGWPVVTMELADRYDIGSEFFRWEFATAVAGHVMGINPFDQPDVESAKQQTRKMLQEYSATGSLPSTAPALSTAGFDIYTDLESPSVSAILSRFLSLAREGDYVALQAYVNPTPETVLALGELRHGLRKRLKLAVTVGFGPRFLHSTGQLHKGDGGKGLFLQITAADPRDAPIPDEPGSEASTTTFGILKAAQAMGDRQALIDAGRRVIRFHLKGDVVGGIRMLKEAVG